MNIAVLGSGLVGSAIVKDLASESEFAVTAVDISDSALDAVRGRERITCLNADLSDASAVATLVAPFDLVIGAVPGYMGYRTVETVIRAGKNIVDISFFPEDSLTLDALAKHCGVTAIVDCGVAPGCSNLLMGRGSSLLERVDRFVCYVGGLPAVRRKPYEYCTVFSPIDVIEEYTRPARFIENGAVVVKPALSDVELLDFPGVGTLEAFNSDGLRTLATTMPAPNMTEKTLRYPGHADLMRILRDSGFFRTDEISIHGTPVRPLDVTSRLLFPLWQLPEGEADMTVMQVVVEGEREGARERHTWDLRDRYDASTRTTSMARTTGYTCAVVARLVARGAVSMNGVIPPEFLGRDESIFDAIMSGLRERNIVFSETTDRM